MSFHELWPHPFDDQRGAAGYTHAAAHDDLHYTGSSPTHTLHLSTNFDYQFAPYEHQKTPSPAPLSPFQRTLLAENERFYATFPDARPSSLPSPQSQLQPYANPYPSSQPVWHEQQPMRESAQIPSWPESSLVGALSPVPITPASASPPLGNESGWLSHPQVLHAPLAVPPITVPSQHPRRDSNDLNQPHFFVPSQVHGIRPGITRSPHARPYSPPMKSLTPPPTEHQTIVKLPPASPTLAVASSSTSAVLAEAESSSAGAASGSSAANVNATDVKTKKRATRRSQAISAKAADVSSPDASGSGEGSGSKSSGTGSATKKQHSLACLFCRRRKIACPPPPAGSNTCIQCERRHLKCVFPTESHRGMRKKKKTKTEEEAEAADNHTDCCTSPTSPTSLTGGASILMGDHSPFCGTDGAPVDTTDLDCDGDGDMLMGGGNYEY